LISQGFAYAADFVVADRGRMIAPTAADEAQHIRYLLIT
jgi:hypothetical protein